MSASIDFEHHFVDLSELRLHYVTAGQGEPLVLLHGWPQSWYSWREVMARLAPQFRLIAPDLRGLGDSGRPTAGYHKARIAADVWELLQEHLRVTRFFLVGHDWGGPVAFALAAGQPQAVRRLAILDVTIPGDGQPNISQGGKRWHHGFHQTEGLPEALVVGREALYLGWFYENYGARRDALDPLAIAEYLRVYTQPGALRAGFDYYRNLARDIADNQATLTRGKLTMPVLGLGGAKSWGRGLEVVHSLRRVATDVHGGVIEDAGHWLPEEQPDLVAQRLRDFFTAD